MSTTQVAAQLFQLQLLDLDLDRLWAELQVVHKTLQGNPELRELRKEYNSAQQQLQVALQQQKEAEWGLEDINRRLATQEQRLYNGATIAAKELQSLQQEVQRLRAQQSRQEEAVLELIDVAESLQEEAQRRLIALKQAEEDWQQESTALIARQDQLQARQQELEGKRKELTKAFDETLLARYTALKRAKQGRAVSRVEQNSCQWCRVILTPSELQRVRISPELQTCMNCGRILYYDR
jgi:predicted  nucleic acid-binding Zn-ribbon protein